MDITLNKTPKWRQVILGLILCCGNCSCKSKCGKSCCELDIKPIKKNSNSNSNLENKRKETLI